MVLDMDLKILTPNGFKKFYTIDKKEAECLKITFDKGVIKCSKDHKFDDNGNIVIASNLRVRSINSR